MKNKNIFDELVVINSDYKYDFCHYNEVIAGIKSTLDALWKSGNMWMNVW